MNDIREGSVDIADQTFDLEDIDEAYEKDYDKADTKTQDNETRSAGHGYGNERTWRTSSASRWARWTTSASRWTRTIIYEH